MDVLNFFTHLQGEDGSWSGWEKDELSRLKTASADVLENQIWEDGVTDSGDPWLVAVDEDSLELSLHIARLSGGYVAVSGDLSPVASGANLKSVVNDCLIYIRSNRQEIAPTDGATIRMPIGVSAAAFGIFLTERLTAFDEAPDRAQTDIQLGRLQSDPGESFVFISSLATGPAPQTGDAIALLDEGGAQLSVDQFILDVVDLAAADQTIKGDTPAPEPEGDEVREISVASTAENASETPDPSAHSGSTTEQITDPTGPETDAAMVEAVQATEAPGAQMVISAPAQVIVAEDRSEEETQPGQPNNGAVIAASPAPLSPDSAGIAAEPAFDADGPHPFDFASVDPPRPSPLAPWGKDEDPLVDVLPTVAVLDEVFTV